DYRFYFRDVLFWDAWDCSEKTNLPIISVSDFYQPEPFTGWAKDDFAPKWMVYFKNDVAQFGLDSFGIWRSYFPYRYSSFEDNRPATHEEIESTLTKEAKRRGYKGGNTIKGIYGTRHRKPEICLFAYDPEHDRLLTDERCVVYEAGQWAEIVEKPQPLHYTVEGTTYSLDYQDLKKRYQAVVNYSDEVFMDNLPEIAHLACIISFFKGLGSNATISDKGIVHELIHLMTDKYEPTNDLQEIRKSFNDKIKLV